MTGVKTILLIRPKTGPEFLMQKSDKGWQLPQISDGAEREYMVGPVQRAVQEQLRLKVWIVRRLYQKSDKAQNSKIDLYEAELQDELDMTLGFRWGVTEDINSLSLDNGEMGDILASHLKEKRIAQNHTPWFQRGWYDTVKRWITAVLEKNNFVINGPLEQLKASDLSILLRIPTLNDQLFFKATGAEARHEARLSKHLDMRHQGKIVNVVDINENEGWLLMRSLGGEFLRQSGDKLVWQQAINEYAKLQIVEADNIDTLISMGLPDRRLNTLKDEIEKHLAGMCATGLDEETTAKVMALKPELLKMCDEMDDVVPYSIDHGDLHSNNICIVNNEIVFFDWGEATVTHPFFSTRIFWNSIDEPLASESEWLEMINEFRPHYLEPWTKFAPLEALERLLLISDQLACVYRGLSWHLYITPKRENIEDSFDKPSQWLQVLLEHRELMGL